MNNNAYKVTMYQKVNGVVKPVFAKTSVDQVVSEDGTTIANIIGAAGGIATLDANSQLTPSQLPSTVVNTSSLGVASGVATLDSNSKLTASQLPSTVVSTSDLGVANGVATLDSTGKIPSNQLPSVGGNVEWQTLS